jgi:anti-sigma factor ChrR (cupin superfamily)
MTSEPPRHGADHSDRVLLYALGALSGEETPIAETQISACSECAHELDLLRPVIASFVSWPTDVLRPTASLWERITHRITAETGGEPLLPAPGRGEETEWNDVAPGIACKLLATDREKNRVSMLVRLAPGTDYPPHRHEGVEELHMLDGELIVDDQTFRPGDYRRAKAGTVDRRVWTKTGCTCVLITSFRDAIL